MSAQEKTPSYQMIQTTRPVCGKGRASSRMSTAERMGRGGCLMVDDRGGSCQELIVVTLPADHALNARMPLWRGSKATVDFGLLRRTVFPRAEPEIVAWKGHPPPGP